MDALSEILKVVQLNGAIFFNARFTAPWCVASPAAASLAQTLGLGEERVLLYHYMVDGSCLITLEGMAPVPLNAGDIIVFPHGDAHTMASSSGAQPQQMDAQALLRERPRVLHFGGGGAATRFICGYMVCDPRLFQPVLAALPRVVTVNLRGMAQGRWLEASVQHAAQEAHSLRSPWMQCVALPPTVPLPRSARRCGLASILPSARPVGEDTSANTLGALGHGRRTQLDAIQRDARPCLSTILTPDRALAGGRAAKARPGLVFLSVARLMLDPWPAQNCRTGGH